MVRALNSVSLLVVFLLCCSCPSDGQELKPVEPCAVDPTACSALGDKLERRNFQSNESVVDPCLDPALCGTISKKWEAPAIILELRDRSYKDMQFFLDDVEDSKDLQLISLPAAPLMAGSSGQVALSRLESLKLALAAAFPPGKPPVCNVATSRPPTLWREYILRREEARRCGDSAAQLIALRDKWPGEFFRYMAGTNDSALLRPTVKEYARNCLFKLSDHEKSPAAAQLFGVDFNKRIRGNIGTLVAAEGTGAGCMATIIKDPQTEGFAIVTALHCIASHRRLGTSDVMEIDEVWPQLTFQNLEGKKIDINVATNLKRYKFKDGEDIAIIPFASDEPDFNKGGVFRIAERLEVWQPLYILAANPYFSALAKYSGMQRSPSEIMSISLDPVCQVHGAAGSILYHRCQDERGMSGSSIFVAEGGELRIAGVVAGENRSEDYKIPGCADTSVGAENIGVLLPGVLTAHP